MTGYFNDEKRTQQTILESNGIRWYRTGDKGKIDEDGYLTIVDRYSRFAKIGGEMISLGAVEETILQIIDDKDIEVVAVALPDIKKGEKIVLISTGNLSLSTLKQKLIDGKLSPLMLPANYIEAGTIPKLGTGKNDFNQAKKLAFDMIG